MKNSSKAVRKIKIITIQLFLLVSPLMSKAEGNPDNSRKIKLIWADEFNGTGLPDSTKWGYEVGFVRNNEKQFYTFKRIQNVRQESG